jgi:HEAT repeat protein
MKKRRTSPSSSKEIASDNNGADQSHVLQTIARLTSPDSRERMEAAWKLGDLKDGKPVKPLIEALKDDKLNDALKKRRRAEDSVSTSER